MTLDPHSPGADAIISALSNLYGYQQPATWHPERRRKDGGSDPLDEVRAYATENHWHYVSMGLSELYQKESNSHDKSGYGFELTFRLRRKGSEPAASWPVKMLQRLARYVYQSHNVFRPGDHMSLNGGMGGQRGCKITATLFAEDSELHLMDTPNGTVRFIQIYGITEDELDAVKDWQCERFLQLVRWSNPMLLTDLWRVSAMSQPEFAQACLVGARQDGSSHGASFAPLVEWKSRGEGLELTVGAIAVPDLLRMLTLRIPYNRRFRLHGRNATVKFQPALSPSYFVNGTELVVDVPWDSAASMTKILGPKRGRYDWPGMPGLTLVVEPTDVRGSRGELVEVIG